MLTALLPRILVGINPLMARDKRHGVVHVGAEQGGVTQQSFMIDKPERLLNPSNHDIKEIFSQITKMGMQPAHLEIMLNNQRRVYKLGVRQPILNQSLN